MNETGTGAAASAPAEALCARLNERVTAYFQNEHGFGRHASTRAGSLPFGGIGKGCDRYHYLNRTEDAPRQADVRGRQRMRVGKVLEKDVGRLLDEAGVDVHRLPYKLTDNNRGIAGVLDFCLLDEATGLYVPLEIKSLLPYVFDDIRPGNLKDVLESKYWWVRSYPGQLLTYLVCPPDSRQAEYGVLGLVSIDGRLNFIPVALFDDALAGWAGEMLARAERVQEAVRTVTPPERLPEFDDDLCGHCSWADEHCWKGVARASDTTLALLEDEEFVAALRTVVATREAAERHEEAEKLVKARLKVTEPDAEKLVLAVPGDNIIVKRTTVHVRARVEPAKPEKAVPASSYFKTKIETAGAPALGPGGTDGNA